MVLVVILRNMFIWKTNIYISYPIIVLKQPLTQEQEESLNQNDLRYYATLKEKISLFYKINTFFKKLPLALHCRQSKYSL